MRLFHTKPALTVLGLGLCLLCLGWLAAQPLLAEPWLGLRLQPSDSGDAVLVAESDPAWPAAPPVGAQLLRLEAAARPPIALQASDLIEEPDFFDTYAEMDEFFARQTALSGLLGSGAVTVVWRDLQGEEYRAVRQPARRTWLSLPVTFWFQLGVGFTALLIAAWVFVLRPGHAGVRMFALTGLAFPVFTVAAAVYSSRALALPGLEFRWLSSLNHAGANLFGCALVGLFLQYPRSLVPPRALWLLALVFGPWWLADALRWAPDQNWGSRLPVMLQLGLAIVGGVIQWRSSRRQPLDRAALRWFALSCLLSSSLFILLVYVPSMVGWFAPLPQAYAFGFFLLMFVGIALGLGKYRLFDLDEWAYRVWLWLVGVMAVVGMDAVLLYVGLHHTLSLGVTFLVCGGVYFPFRQWLWQRLLARRLPRVEALLPEISRIAFTASGPAQQAAWAGWLGQLFEPLDITPTDYAGTQACIEEDGLALQLPACAGLPAYRLRHAGRGVHLFSSRDAQFASGLAELMAEMMSGRQRYELGVKQERLRIGRDLHDNIGARLLKLIHQLRGTPSAEVAREAMKDLRTSIAALDTQPVPLADALADWRAEAESRCEVQGCDLHWQQPEAIAPRVLPARTKAMLEAVLREMVTNALKHADPTDVWIECTVWPGQLALAVRNNGRVLASTAWKEGYGLRNIRSRLADIGARLTLEAGDAGACLRVEAPLP